MSFLLDTCVLSELVKPRPSGALKKWLSDSTERSLYISVLTIGEIQNGIQLPATSRKRRELEVWLHDELMDHFEGRILALDEHVAMTWGRVNALASRKGRSVPTMDGLIAATAIANDLVLVTRNVSDFDGTGAEVIDPWG